MASFISKYLLTTTVTTPTFLSLGLIGVIKDSENYFLVWNDMLTNAKIPTSFEWHNTIVCNLRLQPVFAVGQLNGFMNISKRDLLWMMSG